MKGAEQSTFIHGGVCGNRYTCLKIKKTVSDDYLKESCEAGFFLIYKELRMRKYFFNMVRTKVILLFCNCSERFDIRIFLSYAQIKTDCL